MKILDFLVAKEENTWKLLSAGICGITTTTTTIITTTTTTSTTATPRVSVSLENIYGG